MRSDDLSMHPTRTHLNIWDVQNTRRSSPPSNVLLSGFASTHPQTPLPSIRQLHSYLPPTGISAPVTMPDSPASMPGYHAHTSDPYSQGQSHHVVPHYATRARESNPPYPLPESEINELEQQCPPKKKRRRQALSCTECKRRKIKCDRSKPCAPCTRRKEQAKCHWYAVESVEKDVTRQEFDELKSRLEDLEALVHQILPPDPTPHPMSRHRLLPGVPVAIAVEAVPSFHADYNDLPYQNIGTHTQTLFGPCGEGYSWLG